MSGFDADSVYHSMDFYLYQSHVHRFQDWLSDQEINEDLLNEGGLLTSAWKTARRIYALYSRTHDEDLKVEYRAAFVELTVWCCRFERRISDRLARTFEQFSAQTGMDVTILREAMILRHLSPEELAKLFTQQECRREEAARRREEMAWRRGLFYDMRERPRHLYMMPCRETLLREALAALSV